MLFKKKSSHMHCGPRRCGLSDHCGSAYKVRWIRTQEVLWNAVCGSLAKSAPFMRTYEWTGSGLGTDRPHVRCGFQVVGFYIAVVTNEESGHYTVRTQYVDSKAFYRNQNTIWTIRMKHADSPNKACEYRVKNYDWMIKLVFCQRSCWSQLAFWWTLCPTLQNFVST